MRRHLGVGATISLLLFSSTLLLAQGIGHSFFMRGRVVCMDAGGSVACLGKVDGAQGDLVTAVSPKAFQQALGMVRRGGTVALNGITVRGSIVGTRLDLIEVLAFAGEGKVRATVHSEKLENINDVFARMHHGDIEGWVVLDLA